MSMKAEDLMIGDWVYITDHPIRKEVKQVKPEHFIRSLVTFEPIQLTPEILDKNGFERQEVYGYHFSILYYDNQEVCILCWDTNKLVLHNDNCECRLSDCTYVHELQQLLRLCKIDKEIII